MPVYEYECPACGGRFEATRKFSDPDLTVCSLCNASGVRKMLSAPSFVLKGTGWYVTDYATSDRKKGVEADKPNSGTAAPAGCGSGSCGAGACPAKS